MRKTLISLVSMLVLSLLLYTAQADELPISANLKLYGTYTDNIFQTITPESDYVSLTYLDASYGITSGTSVFYNTNLNLFSEHTDLLNHAHYLGINSENDVFDGFGVLSLEGKLGLRQNMPEYDLYDRRISSINANLKYYLTETIIGKVGYNIARESYPNYQTFNYLENYGFVQFSKFFQTRTTLQANFDAGRRDYPNIAGKNYATQMTGSIKVAQSLAELTGLQLQYTWHHLLQGIESDNYLESGYYSVEDFLDDDYSYSSHEYLITLKHMAPWSTTLKGTFSRENRDYKTLYTDDGEQKREDSDTILSIEIEKKFSVPSDSFSDFSLYIEFLHRKNKSNDEYYSHSTNIFSVGTRLAF